MEFAWKHENITGVWRLEDSAFTIRYEPDYVYSLCFDGKEIRSGEQEDSDFDELAELAEMLYRGETRK